MPEQRRQIVERIDFIQFAGVDQAHEEIADVRAGEGLIKGRVLAVQNRLFERAFANGMPPARLCRVGRSSPPLVRDLGMCVV